MIIKLKWWAGTEFETTMSTEWWAAGSIADALVDSHIDLQNSYYLVDRRNKRFGWGRIYENIDKMPPDVCIA